MSAINPKIVLYLSFGAIAGTLARYSIGVWIARWNTGAPDFPWATFLINVTGSLFLGFLLRYLTGTSASQPLRLMLTTGFCGAYTTMSTFSFDFMALVKEHEYLTAALYMGGTMSLAPAACFLGYGLASVLL
jgi:fluoride exporter